MYLHYLLQKLDIRDNPDLTMPPKPVQQVKGSGAEWYNIDFDPEILKKGAVVSAAQVIKGQWVWSVGVASNNLQCDVIIIIFSFPRDLYETKGLMLKYLLSSTAI